MYWRIVFAFAGIKSDDDGRMQTIVRNKPECPPNTRAVYKVEEWGRTEKNRGVVADGRDGCGLSCHGCDCPTKSYKRGRETRSGYERMTGEEEGG